MIDFTNCKKFKKGYGGANGNKICIEYNGEKYMLKFPPKPTKNPEQSYTNSCLSEYICCHIYEMLGIPAQETILGTYKVKEKEKIVVACKDLTAPNITIQDFAYMKNGIIDSERSGYGTELDDILETINSQQNIDNLVLKDRFWEMFVVDSFIGNFDRHNGNWGFLYNSETDEINLCPIFDCGSCLYPQADSKLIGEILLSDEEQRRRVYDFPTSAVKINGSRINYYEFFKNTKDKDCLRAIKKIYPKINLKEINNFIDNIEVLLDKQKTFYKKMLNLRYDKILTPVYKRAKKQDKLLMSDYKEKIKEEKKSLEPTNLSDKNIDNNKIKEK